MVKVHGKPTARAPTKVELTTNQNASLICPIGGYPLSAATWKKEGGNQTSPNLMTKSIELQDPANPIRTDLVLENIKLQDAGTYECKIGNVVGKIKVTVTDGNQIFCWIEFLNP